MIEVRPATAGRYGDVEELFRTNGTTKGCWCMFFVVPNKEFSAGWGAGNHEKFGELVGAADPPAGLLAYRAGEPVGWCAIGPRSRYGRALRSKVLQGRATAEDDSVWLLPCFFVRRDARRSGVTRELIAGAVELARGSGASAVEAFPLASTEGRAPAGDAFIGTEAMFAACGFEEVSRPTPRRVLMRRPLSSPSSRRR